MLLIRHEKIFCAQRLSSPTSRQRRWL
jgi:hypothetical protein